MTGCVAWWTCAKNKHCKNSNIRIIYWWWCGSVLSWVQKSIAAFTLQSLILYLVNKIDHLLKNHFRQIVNFKQIHVLFCWLKIKTSLGLNLLKLRVVLTSEMPKT